MRFVAGLLISLCVVASQAVAAEPPQSSSTPSNPPPSADSAPAAKSAATTTAAGTAKTDSAAADGVSESQIKSLRAAGYKPEVRNGKTLYCRKEATMGTRFESKVCGTAEDLERKTRQSQDVANSAQRESGQPPGK